MSDRLLTLEQVADETGYSVQTIRRFLAPVGDLACIRSGLGSTEKRRTHGTIRIRRADLDRWIDRHRAAPASERRPEPNTLPMPKVLQFS